jgi:hypothetical protein
LNLFKMVFNSPMNQIDRLGLAVIITEGGLSTTLGDGSNCSVTIYFGHGHTSGNPQTRVGTIHEQFDKDSERGDECNKSIYVGCGANSINTAAGAGGFGVPDPPKNNQSFPPETQPSPVSGVDPKSDCLHEGSEPGRIREAINSAKSEAGAMADMMPPCCCFCVRVQVICIGGILAEIELQYKNVEGGAAMVKQLQGLCNYNEMICMK